METKSKLNRFAAVFLALAMLLTLIPFSPIARAEEAAGGGVYELNASELPLVKDKNNGTFTDGQDPVSAGTKDYFKIHVDKNTRFDGSNQKFDDGFAGTQRINFNGGTKTDSFVNSIEFTAANPATVKVWWRSGDVGRYVVLFDQSGKEVAKTEAAAEKNTVSYIDTFEISTAGKYYIGNLDKTNYIFKIEVTEHAPKSYVLNASDLPLVKDKNNGTFTDGQNPVAAGTEDFFKIHVDKNTRFDGSNQKFDDGFAGTQRINFNSGTKTDSFVNSIEFTVAGPAKVKVWWRSGDVGRYVVLFDQSGKEVAKTEAAAEKNTVSYIDTFEISTAGKYYIGNLDKTNYIFQIEVTAGAGEVVRGDWSKVDAPVIDKAEQADGSINVTVTADVGNNGGDKVVIDMLDKDGKVVETKQSLAEKTEHTLTFTPKATGTYTFKATLSREGEDDKKAAKDGSCEFTLPLGQPTIVSATSMGGGKIALVWTAVDEAKSYTVFCDGKEIGTTDKTAYTASDLKVDTKYSFTVQAVRGADKGEISAAKAATATKDAKQVWGHIYYGTSTDFKNNYAAGDLNEDGKVTVVSKGGKGKVVPNGADGLSFYYTAVPNSLNFTLRAKVTVDTWTYSNGQDGFGLLALDSLPDKPNTTAAHWTNQYMLAVSKMEYRWDSENNKLSYESTIGDKYNMQLGVGVNTKLHITPENRADVIASVKEVINLVAPGTQYTLETSAVDQKKAAGTYNIVGNVANPASLKGDTITNNGKGTTEFILELQRNNTGYFMTYYAADGKTVIGRQKFYDPKALSALDKDNVYVGFFAARNAEATFSDVVLTTIDPSKDAPAEEKPVEKVTPIVNITSASIANSTDYNLMLNANVNGTADISLNGEVISSGNKLTAKQLFSKTIKLTQTGSNKIEVVFTPDPDQDLGEDKVLASTGSVTAKVTVKYNVNYSSQKNLYVAPNGTSAGNGTAEHPLDVYTAVSVAEPGQTIIVMDGEYKLTAPVRIERGMNGTADKPIRMIADPDAKSRPVFNFSKASEGFRLGGNYWYMRGFDVTNSANGSTGFRVCGDNNTLDQINAYNNGNTGIQISAFRDSSDPKELWPKNNLILNCTSYNNADGGYEDADGFAAKLTCGEGNVFDGCVAYNNADDGWDLYAKVSTGNIGAVTIKNCMAYNNGYLLDGTKAGNGNGFKLGGDSLAGGHKLINSIAFGNKANGITSNSCPDVQVINCTAYNNGSGNLTLYTGNSGNTTEFTLEGLISCGGAGDSIKKNANDKSTIKEDTNKVVTEDAFVSTKFEGLERNADGTIKLGDFLKLKEASESGADFSTENGSTPSEDIGTVTPDKPEDLGVVFKDNDSKIEATAPVGAFDNTNDITFNADPVPEETDSKKFTYELSFTDKDGNKVQPNIAVKVAIPVPDALKDKTVYVYHVENDGTLTAISSTVENGMVIFSASKFSKYVLTSEAQSNPETGVAAPIALAVLAAAGIAAACIIKRKRG